VIPSGGQLDALLSAAADDDAGVVSVPALQGLGTPAWDAGTSGALLGLRPGAGRAELVRAVVDGVLHQVADALDAIAPSVRVETVRLDGGLARSPWIVQRLADLAGVRVERSARHDATVLGAATLAGLAAGVWDSPDALPEVAAGPVAEPEMDAVERERRRERWAAARELTASWR
jgi:glycerol kinase